MDGEIVNLGRSRDLVCDALVPNCLKVLWVMLRDRCMVGFGTRLLLPRKLRVGRGTVIRSGTITSKSDRPVGIEIGARCLLQDFVSMHSRGDFIRIGDRVGINSYCYIDGHGGVTIGSNTLLGPGVRIVGNYETGHPGTPWSSVPMQKQGVHVGENCWIGANAVLVDGATIGNDCIVGAGAVVTGAIPARSIAVGLPARVVRMR